MKKQTKKLIAPIVITALIVVYLIGFIAVAVTTDWIPRGWMIALTAVPVCAIGVMAYVLVQRIKEIRSGEEDDLGQY